MTFETFTSRIVTITYGSTVVLRYKERGIQLMRLQRSAYDNRFRHDPEALNDLFELMYFHYYKPAEVQ